MFNQDEGKIYRMRGWKYGDMFLAGQECQDCSNLFLTSGFAVFIVSSSWYCQIQTCKLIMFFRQNDLKNPEMF